MASIRPKFYTRPVPTGSVPITHKGKPAVRFPGRDGKPVLAVLTADGTRCRVRADKWYGRYVDAGGVVQEVPLSANRDAARLMLADILRRVERERAGDHDPYQQHRKSPLTVHLDDYRRALLADGCTAGHSDLVKTRVSAALSGCRFVFLPDLSASRLAEWLADMRSMDRKRGGFSIQTSNHYLTGVKAFLNWMVRDKRTAENPFRHLERGNVKLDRRHDRRELTADEIRRLLTAARQSTRRFKGLTGEDRYFLYATAAGSGFRASELASLTPESFNLAADPPLIALNAEDAKNRTDAAQPIPDDLADELRGFLIGRPAGEPVWPGTWASSRKAAPMLRVDLEAAGIPYVVQGPAGPLFADFHSLRHSYITLLDRGGVSLRTAQALARHSTPVLTARYSHPRLNDMAEGAAKLPAFLPPRSGPESVRATGTDGRANLPPKLPPAGGNGRVRLRVREETTGGNSGSGDGSECLELKGIDGPRGQLKSGGGGIRTLAGDEPQSGFQDRRNRPLCHPSGKEIVTPGPPLAKRTSPAESRIAPVGQTAAHAPHEMQSIGRGSHGSLPRNSRQAVGQTATQSSHPMHRVSSSTGNSSNTSVVLVPLVRQVDRPAGRLRSDHPPQGRRHQPADQVLQHRPLQRREQDVPRAQVEHRGRPRCPVVVGELHVAEHHCGRVRGEPAGVGHQPEWVGPVGRRVRLHHQHRRPRLPRQLQCGRGLPHLAQQPPVSVRQLPELVRRPGVEGADDDLREAHGRIKS